MRYGNLPEDGDGSGLTLVKPGAERDSIEVPEAALLLGGDYTRVGADLLLSGADGPRVLVEDYFAHETPPDLVAEGGFKVWPSLVEALAGPMAPGQYAQATSPTGAPQIGKITELSGTARVIRTNGVEEELSLDDPVFQGDVLITNTGSSVGITFIDDTLFSIAGEGRLVLDQLIFNPGGGGNSLTLSLVQGAFAFVTGQISGGDGPGMEIKTPVATIGIRGTTGAGSVQVPTVEIPYALVVSLLEELGGGPSGVIDVFTPGFLLTLADILATAGVAAAGGPVLSIELTPEIEAAFQGALVSLVQSFSPEAGEEEEEDQDASNDPGANEFFDVAALLFGTQLTEAIEQVELDLEAPDLVPALALALIADPNLLLLLTGEEEAVLPSAPTVTIETPEGPEASPVNGAGEESGEIPLDIVVTGATSVEIAGVPEGAVLRNAGTGFEFTAAGPGPGTASLGPDDLEGLVIVPPAFSDADFVLAITASVETPLGPLSTTEELPVQVEAVADLADVAVNEGDNGGVPGPQLALLAAAANATTEVIARNPIQFEFEGQGNQGLNDDLASAQDLGQLDAPAGGAAPDALTVNGWLSKGVPGREGDPAADVDVFKVTLAEDGSYTFDIDFGGSNEDDGVGSGGRIDAVDSLLSVFDADGNLIETNDDDEGFDPSLTLDLVAGMYFVAVSNANKDGADNDGVGGDYQLQVRGQAEDVVPGDIVRLTFDEDDGTLALGEAVVFGANLNLVVRDPDGSESITRVEISVDPAAAPPDLMLDLAGSGEFLGLDGLGAPATLSIPVTRLDAGGSEVTEAVDAALAIDPASGRFVLTFDDSLRVQEVDLSGFAWKVPQHDDNDFPIVVTTRTTETHPSEGIGADAEGDNGDTDQVGLPHQYQTVTIEAVNQAVADAPQVTVEDRSYPEDNQGLAGQAGSDDQVYELPVSASVDDRDGSEGIEQIKLTLPDGLAFEGWTHDGNRLSEGLNENLVVDGVEVDIEVSGNMLTILYADADAPLDVEVTEIGVELAEHSSGMFQVDVEVTAKEVDPNGAVAQETAVTSDSFMVTVEGVADPAEVAASNLASSEDDPAGIQFDILPGLSDRDGSESLVVEVSGIPADWVQLDAGNGNFDPATGTWTSDPLGPGDDGADFVNPTFLPPPHFNTNGGPLVLDVLVTTTEDPAGKVQAGGGETSVAESFSIVVTPVNDSPAVLGGNDLDPIAQDAGGPFGPGSAAASPNPGNLVSEIVVASDPDAENNGGPNGDEFAALGMAIVRTDTGGDSGGQWQFSTDGGTNWSPVGAVSEANALLLGPDARLRFVPGQDFALDTGFGAGAPQIEYRVWDGKPGPGGETEGDRADVSDTGGETGLSTDTAIASIDVLTALDINMVVTQAETLNLPVNLGPANSVPSPQIANEVPYFGFVAAINATAEPVSFSVDAPPTQGSLDSFDGNGEFFYAPPAPAPGSILDGFTYVASDDNGSGVSDTGEVAITARSQDDFGDVTGGAGIDILYANPFIENFAPADAGPGDSFLVIQRLDGGGGDDLLVGADGLATLSGPGGKGLAGFDGPPLFPDGEVAPQADATTVAASDELIGGEGNDSLLGNGGDDSLFGDDEFALSLPVGGDDLLAGGGGDDRLFGDAGRVKPGAKGFASLEILNLLVTDAETGTAGDPNDRGSALIAGDDINITASNISGFAAGSYNTEVATSGAAPSSLQCAGPGDCSAIAENDFSSQGSSSFGEQDFGRGDNDFSGAIVAGTGTDTPASVRMVAEGQQTRASSTSGTGNMGLTASFQFELLTPTEIRLSFDGVAELIAGLNPDSAGTVFASHSFTVSVTDSDNNQIFSWQPGSSIVGGVEEAAAGSLINNRSSGIAGDGRSASVSGFFAATTTVLAESCQDGPCTLTISGSTFASTNAQEVSPLAAPQPPDGNADDLGLAFGDIQDGSSGGNDSLLGGDGEDTLFGDAGNDIRGGSAGGDDTLQGDADDDILFGDAGDDIETGSAGGNDTLDGGSGNDNLIGDAGGSIDGTSTAGSDTLIGGEGNDNLHGDAIGGVAGSGGADVFVFRLSEDSGDDRIFDAEAQDAIRLQDVFDYAVLPDAVGPGGLDSDTARGDGWSVSDDNTDVTVTFGDNNGDGLAGGDLGVLVIEGIGNGSIDSFQELAAAINLQINV